MPRDLEHLTLPRWQQPIARRRIGGGRPPVRDSRAVHGKKLETELAAVDEAFTSLRREPPAGIDPKLVFNIRLHRAGSFDDDELRAMGLRLVAREPNKLLVVFPDSGALEELRRRIRDYAGHDKAHYANIAAIEAIEARKPEDKLGPRLQREPLSEREENLLDISLWHSGNRDECLRWINDLTSLAKRTHHRVTDWWIGNDMCLMRMNIDQDLLDTILQIDFVRSVDRRAKPSYEFKEVTGLSQYNIDINPDPTPLDDLAGIVVVDSGVMQGHPLLAPIIGDAQSFVPGDDRPEDVDEISGGHGTAVAGIAAYGDIGNRLKTRRFVPDATIFSGRILNEHLEYDPEKLLEHQLDELVTYFVTNYSNIRIVNLSIGNLNKVFDGANQSTLAAVIDQLAFRFRDKQLLFIVASGNYSDTSGENAALHYPNYLYSADARLIEPATSAISLTVGGVAYGPGTDPQETRHDGVENLIAQNRGWPSPFTRVGFGVNEAVKPDVVDFAGDIRFERGRAIWFPAQHAGLPTTSKTFAPPDGQLFRTVAGTSFSAPRVANLAARLFRDFPSASANLIRALIASSARIPTDRPPQLTHRTDDADVLQIYGYGIPHYERARFSAGNEVLLLAEEEIRLDTFQVFSLPAFPEEYLSVRGDREISVTLAFDPPTRQTRSDSYLGVRMYAHLFRNIAAGDLLNRLRAMTKEDIAAIGVDNTSLSRLPASMRVELKPGVNIRRKGTLQRGVASVRNSSWQYNGADLLLAVVCQRMWAPVEIDRQRFAIVVSVAHSEPSVPLYAHIRQRAQLWQRVRIRV